VCTECGGTNLLRDYETGELVCERCGFVLSSTILDQGPEWRAFDQEQRDKLPRVGAPVTWTIHDKGLSTTIGWQDRDASGRKLSPEERARLYRLRKWHRRSKVSDSTQRNLAHALSEMSKIAYKLNLPRNVIETSSMIYRQAINANLIRGRTIQGVVVACIYLACRQCGVIRSLEDVAISGQVSKNYAARNYRFLVNNLNLSVPKVNPEDYIGNIVNKLQLSGDSEKIAKIILVKAVSMRLTIGRGPAGIAAACVYIGTKITGEFVTQSDIAGVAQITEVTIRNRYKELIQYLDLSICL